MSEYGVLLIGGKRTHQEAHGPIFANHPRCSLVGVAAEPDEPDFRKGSGRALAEQLAVPYLADMDAALSRDDVHVVSSTPHVERRGDILVSCIEAGKHVYMDKPLAGSLEAIDAIVGAASRADVKTQMFSQNRAPWVQEVRQAVEDGTVGEVVSVHAENIFAKGRAGSVLPGTVRREKSPVERYTFIGAKREMFDVGVYSLAWIHMLTGRAVESVFALTGNYFFADHAAVDVEDFGAMALRLEGGVTATAVGGRFGWSSHPKSGPQRDSGGGHEGHAQRGGQRTPRRGLQRRAGLHAAGGRSPRSDGHVVRQGAGVRRHAEAALGLVGHGAGHDGDRRGALRRLHRQQRRA